jgi:hypothetical protein
LYTAGDQQEFPSWVRECDKDFKEKSCTLTHEGRTLQKWRSFVGKLETSTTNPFRQAARHRCSACEAKVRLTSGRSKKLQHNYGRTAPAVLLETEGCTCHEDLRKFLPDLDTNFVPAELLAPSRPPPSAGKRKKVPGAGSAADSRSSRVKLEPGPSHTTLIRPRFLRDEALDSYGCSSLDKTHSLLAGHDMLLVSNRAGRK